MMNTAHISNIYGCIFSILLLPQSRLIFNTYFNSVMGSSNQHKINPQLNDIDSYINYYLRILPQEIKLISRFTKVSEIQKLFQFVKCIRRQFERIKPSSGYECQNFTVLPKKQETINQIQNILEASINKQAYEKDQKLIDRASQNYFCLPKRNSIIFYDEEEANNGFTLIGEKQTEEKQLVRQSQIQIQQKHKQFQEPLNIMKLNSNHRNRNRLRKKNIALTPKKPNRGMLNIGNNCYLNSALQCLYQTQYLKEQLKNKDENNGSCIKQFVNMCEQLQARKKIYSAKIIKQLIQKHNPLFQGDKQHDAGEALSVILNIIDEETNNVTRRKIYRFRNSYQIPDESLFEEYKKKFKSFSFSLIDLVFSGFYKTSYYCSICGKAKRLFEKFTIVYLPLTQKDTYLSSFQDCLKQFYSGQSLEWNCINCGGETLHTKAMEIYKANKTIIFCLKRFNEDHSKIKIPLQIPLELDLNQYITYTHQVSERKHFLYAAIVHKGDHDSGHYIAYCYDYRVKCWAEYNDSIVNVVSKDEIKNCIKNAYLLFYRMQKIQEVEDQ